MKRGFDYPSCRGFSLLEIVIALGLFGIIIGSILGLFPAALRTDRENEEETRALFIASGVMDALASPNGEGPFLVATGMSNNLPLLTTLPYKTGKNLSVSLSYDASCEPLRQLNENETESALSERSAMSVVTLTLSSKPSMPGVLTAEVLVASPASAPAASRSIRSFTRLITAPTP